MHIDNLKQVEVLAKQREDLLNFLKRLEDGTESAAWVCFRDKDGYNSSVELDRERARTVVIHDLINPINSKLRKLGVQLPDALEGTAP
ncbi:MAG: hypothetical protein IOB84_01575 [Brevundimonas sp.]|nr:hypothetical protein [Brevundimonas sp.]